MAFKWFRKCLGIFLLVLVNIVWVGASELARYLFTDLGFKRPIFYTYFKSSMLVLFLALNFAGVGTSSPNNSENQLYSKLRNEDENDYEEDNLTNAEFEPLSLGSESNSICGDANLSVAADGTSDLIDNSGSRKIRRVTFKMLREVRSFPERIAQEAKLARLPYRQKTIDFNDLFCGTTHSALIFSYLIYFAPLWIISSVTYHIALAYTTVSLVNLISSCSSIFVLALGAMFGSQASDKFSFAKLSLVILNLFGVALVSKFSGSLLGATLSLLSAFASALWLLVFSNVSARLGRVNMPLLLGITGLFTIFVCTPLMIIVHETQLEPQLPLATKTQMFIVVFNGIFGTLLGDFLWLYATLLTSSLISTLSMTLSIPLSMIADAYFRSQPPSGIQMIASVPILISFIGASFLTSNHQSNDAATNRKLKMQPIELKTEKHIESETNVLISEN